MSTLAPPMLIADEAGLRELLARLAAATVVALDTESNGMYAYRERVCLLQVSLPGLDAIIDPLAVDPRPLAPWLADPGCVKVLHAADNDVLSLRRDFDLRLCNVFDTMLAARALAWPQRGLGEILATRFGATSDKRWQRHDWSQRPLSHEALAYARTDTHHLLDLRELQRDELESCGRLDEFDHACARITELVPRPRTFDPSGWARIDGAKALDDTARAVLAALFELRDELSRTLDRAPYRVLGDAVLLELARTRPTRRQELGRVRGVGGPVAHRYAEQVVGTIARAAAGPPPPWPPAPERPGPELRARQEALRNWRRDHATLRGLEPDIVLSKDALAALAALDPEDRPTLEGAGILDDWECERYADALLAVLARLRRRADHSGGAAPATTRSSSTSNGAES